MSRKVFRLTRSFNRGNVKLSSVLTLLISLLASLTVAPLANATSGSSVDRSSGRNATKNGKPGVTGITLYSSFLTLL